MIRIQHAQCPDTNTLVLARGIAIVFLFGGEARGNAIKVDAFQAVVKISNYLTNLLLSEFTNITHIFNITVIQTFSGLIFSGGWGFRWEDFSWGKGFSMKGGGGTFSSISKKQAFSPESKKQH